MWQTVQTGYAKGEHKLLAIQATPINLPAEPAEGTPSRFDHDVIQLLAVARHPAVMRWGQAGVFCGVGPDGQRITTGKTVSDDFVEGAEGRWRHVRGGFEVARGDDDSDAQADGERDV